MRPEATLHEVRSRARTYEGESARFAHFDLGPGAPVSAECALGPGWSLYCIDAERRQAMFVQSADAQDLGDAPFAYAKQFAEAQRALVLSIEALPGLAAEITLPERLIFIKSLGRCRSTLTGRIIGAMPGAWSLSEPDTLSNLAMDRSRYEPEEFAALVAAATRLAYRPPVADSFKVFALKPRSQTLRLADVLHAAYPDATFLFLYRDAVGWVRSVIRMAQRYGIEIGERDRETRAHIWTLFRCGTGETYGTGVLDLDAEVVRKEELLALGWVAQIERYLNDLEAGLPYAAFRHDELGGDMIAPLERLVRVCGFSASDLAEAMAAFAVDSQAGTPLARSATPEVIDTDLEERVCALLARHPTGFSPDIRLPDAHTPSHPG